MTSPADFLDPGSLDRPILRVWNNLTYTELTGRQFWALVTRYVEFVEKESRIGSFALVLGHTGPDMMALFLALMISGRLVAFFPPNSPLQDGEYYFKQQREALNKIAPTSICIFDERVGETIQGIDPGLGSRVIVARPTNTVAHGPSGEPHAFSMMKAVLRKSETIFVQHSSGTTGIKKAVGITGAALAQQFKEYWPTIREAAGSEELRIASWLPLYHDMGLVATFLLPILGGDFVSIVDPFEWIGNPDILFWMIEEDAANVCWMPNFAFRHFSRLRKMLPRRNLNKMKLWIDCSEPCRYTDAIGFEEDFKDFGVRPGSVVGCYAMAETVFAISQLAPPEQRALSIPAVMQVGADVRDAGGRFIEDRSRAAGGERLVLSSGRPLPGAEVSVRVEGRDVREGVYGEITIRADFLFAGYAAMTPAESAIGEDGYFSTGDLGVVVDGHVYVFGRIKEVIIVNGKNIFAGDVENLLSQLRGVRGGRAVAFGLDSDQTGSEALIIVAEHDPTSGVDAADTRAAISRLVSETLLIKPRDVRVVDRRWLVKSTSGKISRADNRQKYLLEFNSSNKI